MQINKYELLELAEKHKSHVGVRVMLQSYQEANLTAGAAMLEVTSQVKMIDYVFFAPNAHVPADASALVAGSVKLSTATAKMNMCLFNLADILQSLGEKFDW